MNKSNGFTMIEMVVVISIIALIAGVITPMIFNALGDAKVAAAKVDVKGLATAILFFNKDTGLWPYAKKETFPEQSYKYLESNDGALPDIKKIQIWEGESDLFDNQLTQNTPGYNNWKGPYLQSVGADPWGRKYLAWVEGFVEDNEHAWILSAGPNGILETDPSSIKVQGDDIGVYLK